MTQTNLATLGEFWEAWDTAMPRLTPDEQRAGIVLLRELAQGEPVSTSGLAQVLEVPTGVAEALLRDSALKRFVYWSEDRRVEGFWGLATKPTHHRMMFDGRTFWSWCAQDSLFLPELLDETVRIESTDPEVGDRIRLTLSPQRIEAAEPESLVVSMVALETTDLSSIARIIATACHFIFFFADRASGERWVAAHPQTTLHSLDDAYALARRQNARVFGEELARRAHAA